MATSSGLLERHRAASTGSALRLHPAMPWQQAARLRLLPPWPQPDGWWNWPNVQAAQRFLADRAAHHVPAYPGERGRGIVVVGGGKYFVSAYVTIRVLRHVGCSLPVELWHLRGEIDTTQRTLLEAHGVQCRDADAIAAGRPYRFLNHWWRGWQLKAFALVHAGFREVLLLDADCYPTRNPEFLFDWSGYRAHGACFWPDQFPEIVSHVPSPFAVLGIPWEHGLGTESGQLLIDRRASWQPLHLAAHFNSQADFMYRIVYGDKDTFPLAWKKLARTFARPWQHCLNRSPALIHFGPDGEPLLQHRIFDKFRLSTRRFDSTPQPMADNQFYPAMAHERFCFGVLDELRAKLDAGARRGAMAGGRTFS
jgi:hypothetical protein